MVGFLSGVVGGATALPGPPVVLYSLASPLPVAQMRANLTMFLLLVDWIMTGLLAMTGQLALGLAVLSLLLLVPFSLANAAGSALFRPERAGAYKALSRALIVGSALAGLPMWKG